MKKKTIFGSSLLAQRVEDPALSLPWLRLLPWLGFHPWPRNFRMPQAQPKKKIRVKRSSVSGTMAYSFFTEWGGGGGRWHAHQLPPLKCKKKILRFCS